MNQRSHASTSEGVSTNPAGEDPYAVDVDDPILVRINRRLDSRVEIFESEHVTRTGTVVRVYPGGKYRGVGG